MASMKSNRAKTSASEAPRRRDPERARLAILDAATSEFSDHGFAGARVDRVALAAGLNKAMLYHYFGDKEALYLAVLERAYSDIREAENRLELSDAAPVEAVQRLVEFTWDYFVAHPEFLSLLNTENLMRAAYVKRSKSVTELQSPLVETLGAVLERGEVSGVFRSGIDPAQLYWSIAGLGYFYLSNRHTLSISFDRDLTATDAMDERRAHIVEVILGYLRPE